MHTTDNLLCVARRLFGNSHAGKTFERYEHCAKCKAFKFCKKIERLVKNESVEVDSKHDKTN